MNHQEIIDTADLIAFGLAMRTKMAADRQRERHTRQLVCIILAAALVITAVVALVVEILK